MTWDVSADPSEFDEASNYLLERVPAVDLSELTAEELEIAFTVAGVAQLDLVADVLESVQDAVVKGTTLEVFKAAVLERLVQAWAGTVDDPAWRLETIFRTNLQTAYSRGRYEQATDPVVLAVRPYWMFDGIVDARETEICRKCDGTVLPADHRWWRTHYAPMHFNCRSSVITLTEKQAKAMGITSTPTAIQARPGFGASSGSPWEPEKRDYPAPLWNIHEAKQP